MTDKQKLDAANALRDALNCGADIFGDVDVLDVLKNLDLRGYKITRNQDYEEEKFIESLKRDLSSYADETSILATENEILRAKLSQAGISYDD